MHFLLYVPAMAPYGGIERHVCGLAAALATRGHTVRFLTTGNALGPALRAELDHPRITLRELPRAPGQSSLPRKLVWLAQELIFARRTPADVIYTHAQSGLARLVWQAATSATRIVHHHHTAADPGEQATWSPAYLRLLRRAPHLVGCSQATCDALNNATGRTDATFLPYLAAAPVALADLPTRPPHRPLRFGFLGRLIPEKGIDTVLALARDPALADLSWHIHGAGDAYPPAHFVNLPRVHYHGAYRTPAAHAAALLSLDAQVLFSTHNEGMPLSLIEGMSAGLPWIATDRGGTRELAASPANSVVLPADASLPAITAAVRELATRIQRGTTSRRTQRAAYDTRFAPPAVTTRYLTYFASLPPTQSNPIGYSFLPRPPHKVTQ